MLMRAQLVSATIKRLLARMDDDEKTHAPGVYFRRESDGIDDGHYDTIMQTPTPDWARDEAGWTSLGRLDKS